MIRLLSAGVEFRQTDPNDATNSGVFGFVDQFLKRFDGDFRLAEVGDVKDGVRGRAHFVFGHLRDAVDNFQAAEADFEFAAFEFDSFGGTLRRH